MEVTSSSQETLDLAGRRLSEIHLDTRDYPQGSSRTVECPKDHLHARREKHAHGGDSPHNRSDRKNRIQRDLKLKSFEEMISLALTLDDPACSCLLETPQLDASPRKNNNITQSTITQRAGSLEPSHATLALHAQRYERLIGTEIYMSEENGELFTALSDLKQTLKSKWTTISIKSRYTVVKEVMHVYDKYPDTATHQLGAKFEGENGLDSGGVMKDMLGSFWTNASQIFFHGEDILVPCSKLENILTRDNDYRVLGRIMSHTLALTGTLPFNMPVESLVTVFKCGMPSESDSDFLLQEYLMFVNMEERKLMEKALFDFASLLENEMKYLVHIFETHGHTCLPRKHNVRVKLTEIAAKVLIHDPTYYLLRMKEGIPESQKNAFWSRLSKSALRHLVERQNPTSGRVAEILTPNEQLTPKETEVYAYLVNFVERLDKRSLRTFLQFVTGYTRIPKDGITVCFNHELKGLQRRPIAHTCSNQLDLSVHYSDYEDFLTEMTAILDNPLSMHMYMA